jgi:hypothetical protein
MKTNIAIQNGCIRNLKSAAAILGLLIVAGSAKVCQAAPSTNSPVGPTWDISFSGGGRVGLANITFSSGSPLGSFVGYEIIAPSQPGASQPSGRLGGGGDSRGSGSSTNSVMGTNIFGFEPINGNWGFDNRGRVIGSWIELTPANACITNVTITSTTVTNGGTVTTVLSTNTAVNCDALTNQVSFVGNVVPGKRLTLVASTSTGEVTYQGVPDVQLTNITGQWYGYKNEQQQTFLEFFTLTPVSLPGGGLNTYDFQGSGPGYFYNEGLAILTAQKKIAFSSMVVYPTVGTNVLSAVGSFNLKSLNAQTKGLELTPTENFPLNFKASKSP